MIRTAPEILLELLGRILNPRRRAHIHEEASSIHPLDRKGWLAVITLAEETDVSGLAYDAVLTLPHDQQPDTEVMMRWTAHVQSTERDNLLYRQRLAECLTRLEEHRLAPILMKGVTVGDLYPNPLHRPVGDVDLYVPLDQQHRYVQVLEALGGKRDETFDLKHLTMRCCGMNWELHFRTCLFYNRRTDRRYRLLEREETSADALCHATVEGHTVCVFPPILKLTYMTAHFQHHLLMERVSMRQLIDWMLALHQERTALGISEVSFIRTLRQLGLYRLFRAMGYIATTHLRLDANGYAGLTSLTAADRHRGERLLHIILNGHIPGCKPYRPRLESDTFSIRVGQYVELCKRCFALWPLCPSEAWATPFGFLYHAIERRMKE